MSVDEITLHTEKQTAAQARWGFLWGRCTPNKTPLYTLHPPDLCDLQYNVWGFEERCTVGRGDTPEKAVDNAMRNVTADAETAASAP